MSTLEKIGVLCMLTLAAIAMYHGKQLVQQTAETPAAEVRQSDGSLVLERSATDVGAKAPSKLPTGSKMERKVEVKVRPIGGLKLPANATTSDCPPVTVDLALLRQDDDTRRVVASSPDGRVISGLDIPVDTLASASGKWAAGISLDPIHQTPGIWMDRDWSRLRVGVEINRVRQMVGGVAGTEGRIRIGFAW